MGQTLSPSPIPFPFRELNASSSLGRKCSAWTVWRCLHGQLLPLKKGFPFGKCEPKRIAFSRRHQAGPTFATHPRVQPGLGQVMEQGSSSDKETMPLGWPSHTPASLPDAPASHPAILGSQALNSGGHFPLPSSWERARWRVPTCHRGTYFL